MRLAQTHVWPAFRYFEAMAPLTASSMSASSKTMKGALPPSSRDTFFTVSALARMSSLPTSVEPVKESLRTRGLPVSSRPMPSAGLITTVQPAANAGATLRVIMALGKFQGVIAATTPTGCLMAMMRRSVA